MPSGRPSSEAPAERLPRRTATLPPWWGLGLLVLAFNAGAVEASLPRPPKEIDERRGRRRAEQGEREHWDAARRFLQGNFEYRIVTPVCPEGYDDITGGVARWWDCGVRCPGGAYTNENCECACQRGVILDPTTTTPAQQIFQPRPPPTTPIPHAVSTTVRTNFNAASANTTRTGGAANGDDGEDSTQRWLVSGIVVGVVIFGSVATGIYCRLLRNYMHKEASKKQKPGPRILTKGFKTELKVATPALAFAVEDVSAQPPKPVDCWSETDSKRSSSNSRIDARASTAPTRALQAALEATGSAPKRSTIHHSTVQGIGDREGLDYPTSSWSTIWQAKVAPVVELFGREVSFATPGSSQVPSRNGSKQKPDAGNERGESPLRDCALNVPTPDSAEQRPSSALPIAARQTYVRPSSALPIAARPGTSQGRPGRPSSPPRVVRVVDGQRGMDSRPTSPGSPTSPGIQRHTTYDSTPVHRMYEAVSRPTSPGQVFRPSSPPRVVARPSSPPMYLPRASSPGPAARRGAERQRMTASGLLNLQMMDAEDRSLSPTNRRSRSKEIS